MISLDQGGAARTSIRFIEVPGALAPLVDFIWIDHGRQRTHSWRIVADDAPHVVYARGITRHSSFSRLHLVGARSRFVDIDTTRRFLTIGVRLRRGAIPCIARESAHVLTDQSIPLADVLATAGQAHRDLDGVSSVRDQNAIGRIIASLLRSKREPNRRIQRLSPATGVSRTAHAFGISERALREFSYRHVGMSPRRFIRIERLHRALLGKQRRPCHTWSAIAADAGYADHAHLIRECQDLLGESPAAFIRRGEG